MTAQPAETLQQPEDGDTGFHELGMVAMLLGDIWKHELKSELLQRLRSETFADALTQIGVDVSELDGEDETVLETLDIDYCKILVGPANAHSPVQSVWAENRYHGDAFASSQKFYELLVDRTESEIAAHQSMADHFGMQLHFLGQSLCAAASDDAVGLARTFFQLHIRWIPNLMQKVETSAETAFYRSLAKTTTDFLTLIHESLIGQ
jgi:TorA maturation chaperone TorD